MAKDPNKWEPNVKQAPFLALPDTIREAFYGGGAGSGKSDVLLVYPLARKWYKNPRFKQVFMRRTHAELKKEIVPRSRELYLRFGATFNHSDMVWTFPREDQFGSGARNNGAVIYLGHCEHDNDVHIYDSMEINLFTPDELTSYTEWIYTYISFTRVRTSDSELPAIIRAAGMPGGIGHTWVKRRFVDPFKTGGKKIIGKGGNTRIYIHATLADNPYIDPGYGQSLESLSEAELKSKKYGDWDAYAGSVFNEFRDRPYPDEPENAQHLVEPFEIPAFWPKFIIGDWGYAAQTYIMFIAVSPHGQVYIYRELHWRKTKIEEWAPYVKYFIDKENPKVVKFCRSAKQDRGQNQTIQQQLSEALGVNIELSDNSPGSRIAGKILVHEYLRWNTKKRFDTELSPWDEEQSLWILRNKGLDAYHNYNSLYIPSKNEENIPKLQIFMCSNEFHEEHVDCCPLVVEAIKACIYEKPNKDGKPIEDVAEWDGDDPYDTLRYAVDTAESYFVESAREYEKIQEMQKIENDFSQSHDYNRLYNQLRAVERNNKVASGGIQRFSRRGR